MLGDGGVLEADLGWADVVDGGVGVQGEGGDGFVGAVAGVEEVFGGVDCY